MWEVNYAKEEGDRNRGQTRANGRALTQSDEVCILINIRFRPQQHYLSGGEL